MPKSTVSVVIDDGAERVSAEVETVPLSGLGDLEGTMVVTAKAYANPTIARELAGKAAKGPVVILQNGVGVEKPFLEAGFPTVLRCVLYATGQAVCEHEFRFRPIASSPIGVVSGSQPDLQACVEALNTAQFPFHAETNIQREVWKKAIINSVFHSVCPLLEVDNGIFVRSEAAASLALEVVRECLAVADRPDLGRTPNRHQSFGRGIHFCLGAPLARLEAQLALKGLLEAFPELEFAAEAPTWRPATMFRGLERFPVAFA